MGINNRIHSQFNIMCSHGSHTKRPHSGYVLQLTRIDLFSIFNNIGHFINNLRGIIHNLNAGNDSTNFINLCAYQQHGEYVKHLVAHHVINNHSEYCRHQRIIIPYNHLNIPTDKCAYNQRSSTVGFDKLCNTWSGSITGYLSYLSANPQVGEVNLIGQRFYRRQKKGGGPEI